MRVLRWALVGLGQGHAIKTRPLQRMRRQVYGREWSYGGAPGSEWRECGDDAKGSSVFFLSLSLCLSLSLSLSAAS